MQPVSVMATGVFFEACAVVNESILSSAADLLSLAICGVEAMSSTSILEVRVGASDSTLSSNSTPIGELERQIEFNKS